MKPILFNTDINDLFLLNAIVRESCWSNERKDMDNG